MSKLSFKDPIKEAKKAIDKIAHAGNDAVNKVNKTGGDAIGKVNKAGEEASKSLQQEVPRYAKLAFDEIQKDIRLLSKHGFPAKIEKLLQSAAPEATKQSIGFIDLHVRLRDKIDPIKHWVNNPPSSSAQVVKMITELSDEDVVEIHPCRLPFVPYLGIDIAIPVRVDTLVKEVDSILKELL
jgi:hypothetical protein